MKVYIIQYRDARDTGIINQIEYLNEVKASDIFFSMVSDDQFTDVRYSEKTYI